MDEQEEENGGTNQKDEQRTEPMKKKKRPGLNTFHGFLNKNYFRILRIFNVLLVSFFG